MVKKERERGVPRFPKLGSKTFGALGICDNDLVSSPLGTTIFHPSFSILSFWRVENSVTKSHEDTRAEGLVKAISCRQVIGAHRSSL